MTNLVDQYQKQGRIHINAKTQSALAPGAGQLGRFTQFNVRSFTHEKQPAARDEESLETRAAFFCSRERVTDAI